MNRRHFFGMTAAALVGVGLPLSLLPERSIFLPPRQGWYPSDFVMGEVIQFGLSVNQFVVRHDAHFEGAQGSRQPYTLAYLPDLAVYSCSKLPLLTDANIFMPDVWRFDERILRELRQNARDKFARGAFLAGWDASKKLLPLPHGVDHARYV
jgi:hypothetical protein